MIMRWDPPTDDLMPVQWKSKEFQFPYQENFGAYAIYWDEARYSELQLRHRRSCRRRSRCASRVYADRRMVYDQAVPAQRQAGAAAVRLQG